MTELEGRGAPEDHAQCDEMLSVRLWSMEIINALIVGAPIRS